MSLKPNVNVYVSNESVFSGKEGTDQNGDTTTKKNCSVETEDNTNRTVRRFGDDPSHNALEPSNVVDECPAELKTLRYKIMLMNGNTPVEVSPPAKNSYDNLQQFLEKEKNNNTKENWSKLNKSVKNKKLTEFVESYTALNELTEEEKDRLLEVLKQNMMKGKLAKNKEVTYDKSKGIIKEVPCLVFNKITRHFTIKNLDAQKHSTTIKKASFVKATNTATTTSTVIETTEA